MTATLIIGTENGYLVYWNGSTWSRVYDDGVSHTPGRDFLLSLLTTPNHSDQVWAADYDTFHFHYWPLDSTDRGATWTDHQTVHLESILGPQQNTIDADGNLYTVDFSGNIQKSTDRGLTWSVIYTDAISTSSPCVADGYLWWARSFDGTLARLNLDGTGYVTYPIDPGFAPNYNTGVRSRWAGTNRLYAWSGSSIWSIDITNPGAPVLDVSGQPFGTLSGGGVYWLEALTNQIAVAHTYKTGPSGFGQLWRTTDAGLTWTQTLADTADIGLGGSGEQMQTLTSDVTDNTHLWAAATIPHTFESKDQGLTWTERNYAGPSLGAAVAWTSLAIAVPTSSPALRRGGQIHAFY